jgi:hypothetical protein
MTTKVIITGKGIYFTGTALSIAIPKVSAMAVVNFGEAVRVSIFLPLIYARIARVNLMTKPRTMMKTIMSIQNCPNSPKKGDRLKYPLEEALKKSLNGI